MNFIITKSINLKVILFAFIKRPCHIEYLYPLRNNIYKAIINLINKEKSFTLERVKMGKFRDDNNNLLYKLALDKSSQEIFNKRKNIYEKSKFSLINIINDFSLNNNLYRQIQVKNLVDIYYENKKKGVNIKDKIILFANRNPSSNSLLINNKFISIFSIEVLRFFINLGINILKFSNKKEYSFGHKNHLKTQNLFLACEQKVYDSKDFFSRNQITLCESICKDESYVVLDMETKTLYSKNNVIKSQIKKNLSNIFNFLILIKSNLPNFKIYKSLNLYLNIVDILFFMKICFSCWNLVNEINAEKYILNYYSLTSSALLFLAKTFKIPCFFYQGSLQNSMVPTLHAPYAGIISFTDIHEKIYSEQTKKIKGTRLISKRIEYPYNAVPSKEKIVQLRSKIKNKFKLSIAFFDEKFYEDNPFESIFTYHYDDLKNDLTRLLNFAHKNPKILLIFKSKYIDFSLSEIIKRDKDLLKIYNKKQVLELFAKSRNNTRNIVSPSEIGQIADICIGSSWGGTACFEAASMGCRAILIKRDLSIYQSLYPNNVLFDSLDEVLKELSFISCDRDKLNESNLGLYDCNRIRFSGND